VGVAKSGLRRQVVALEIEGSNPSAHPKVLHYNGLILQSLWLRFARRHTETRIMDHAAPTTSYPENLKSLAIVQPGDWNGNGMILEVTPLSGKSLWAIGVPQPYQTTTGPTWVYVIDMEGLTLIDAGGHTSHEAIKPALTQLGLSLSNMERVIITHGHSDHDGGVGGLVEASGGEVWAHELYSQIVTQGSWRSHAGVNSLLAKLMPWSTENPYHHHQQADEIPPWWQNHLDYLEMRRHLKVSRNLKGGDRWSDLTFLHTPGHSPDELSIIMGGVVFTGDHVLPEITPHPTVDSVYPEEVPETIRNMYPSEEQYGLEVYLRSLRTVAHLDPSVLVLPAHRLYNRGKFHINTVSRASDIAQHHVRRCTRIARKLKDQNMTLDELTRATFPARKLTGGNFMSAVTEVTSHLEIMLKTGDVEIISDMKIQWLGTDKYRRHIASIGR
jgi:glyoxylase-like metal-dependent hydrolase (beta-lactamase superfamily II)